MTDWRDQVRIDGVVPEDGPSMVDLLRDVAARMKRYPRGDVGNDVASWSVVWGPEVQFWGVDLGAQPSVGATYLARWVDGAMVYEEVETSNAHPRQAGLVTRESYRDVLDRHKPNFVAGDAEPSKERKRTVIEEMGVEMLQSVHRAGRRPKRRRREPFPNPEAAAWRPKV